MHFRLLIIAILLAACHTDVPMSSSASELPRISVTSDGGITGRGVGGVVIDGGEVTAMLTPQKSCNAPLTNAERDEIRKMLPIVDANDPGHGHPDQIHYTMTAGDRTASWYGEEAPKEIAPLFQRLWHIRQRVLASC
ncbi:MAG TPA: hypothetical protein VGQ46_02595 [Thermoanaerobaculia bacterium]|jgi:hypothetical protein|nr:hypothetical protein [Thermoanaerobaculia bacterium]